MPQTGAISFGGLVTGLDSKTLIKELVRLARLPVQRLEQSRAGEQKRISTFQELNSKLLALKTATKKLLTSTDFFARTKSVSDDTKLTASVTNTAQTGNYAISISALAKGGQETFVGVADQTTAVGTGTFTIQNVGASTIPFTTPISFDATGMSLQQLRDAINTNANNKDANNNQVVTATILDTGSGANRYRLQIKANATGIANDFDVTATASLTKDTDTNVTFAAADASFTVDGVSLTRSTNTVSDVISGVTLTLKATGTATLTVSNDTATIQANIKAFVSAFNDVASFIKDKSTLDQKNSQKNGPLLADNTANGIKSNVQKLMTEAVASLATDYNALNDLGITTGTDGKLVVDDTKLSSALATNADSVSKIFIGSGGVSGVATRVDAELANITNPIGGLIDIRVDGIQARVDTVTDRIDVLERRLKNYESGLVQQFAALERLVSTLQSQGSALTSLPARRTTF